MFYRIENTGCVVSATPNQVVLDTEVDLKEGMKYEIFYSTRGDQIEMNPVVSLPGKTSRLDVKHARSYPPKPGATWVLYALVAGW